MTRVLTGPMAKRWAAVACSFAANEHATFLAPSVLTFDIPLVVAAVAVTLLSLGYDLTQPLLVGTVTALGGQRAGQAMRLNVFMLFTGFGPGSLLFGAALHAGFEAALALFSIVQLVAAVVAIPLFHSEVAQMHG